MISIRPLALMAPLCAVFLAVGGASAQVIKTGPGDGKGCKVKHSNGTYHYSGNCQLAGQCYDNKGALSPCK